MTQTFTGTLYVQTCVTCGISFGMPQDLDAKFRRTGNTFWCPSGHGQSYRETTESRLRAEIATEKANTARADEKARRARKDAEHFERSRNAYKGKVTHLKGKISEGLCPVCNHGFPNLKRHIEAKHPEFKLEEEA